MTAASDPESLDHFRDRGWMRVPGAFSAGEAAAMREAVWSFLAARGVLKDRPETWTQERPAHLQTLKAHPAFQAIGSARTIAAIEEVLQGQRWSLPRDWGGFFLVFPARRPWSLPTGGWHCDGEYLPVLWPPGGVKVHAMFGDVAPRAGAMLILSGSHRLLHRQLIRHPPQPGARSADKREALKAHPYLRDLQAETDPEARIERFFNREEDVDGIPLQVLENTASAGEVILMHPLLLHAAPTVNAGTQPRFLLNADIVVG